MRVCVCARASVRLRNNNVRANLVRLATNTAQEARVASVVVCGCGDGVAVVVVVVAVKCVRACARESRN